MASRCRWLLTMAEGRTNPKQAAAFAGGALIGTLGGLIGLGGAEFRLPLLIGVFRFAVLEAIILNKAMSLIVVASAMVFRTRTVSVEVIASHLDVVANLLAGSIWMWSPISLPAASSAPGSGPAGRPE
jgi:hypothetical protein